MHTFKAEGGTSFHHNSDLSGEVIIIQESGKEISVPGQDILEFVAQYVTNELVAEIEQMTTEEILRIKRS
jgi:hypothetical protein